MVDRVRPLKIESPVAGTEEDVYPTQTNPTEDYLSAKGISFEESLELLIDALDESGNKHLQYTDDSQPTGKTFKSINDKLDDHSDFHLPNGADALTTASAIGLDANSSNGEGDANSFARSNHTHTIAKGNPVTLTPDQSNAEGDSAGFARANHVHNIPTAIGVTVSTDGTNTQGNATSFARSNHTHKVEIARNNIRATGEVQTTSASDVLLPGMTITPSAGTYLVFAYTNSNNSSNGAINRFSIYSGGVQQSNTLDDIRVSNNRSHAWNASCEVTVNGSQAIEIRWNRSAGTARTFGRYITLIRVA